MSVTAPYRARLRYLRHITLWILMAFVGVVFFGAGLGLIGRWPVPLPVAVLLAGSVALTCGMSAYFMITSMAVDGPPAPTRRVRVASGAAAVAAATAPPVAAALDTAAEAPGLDWLLLPGLLTGAAVAGSGLPRWAMLAVGTAVTAASGAAASAVAGRPVLPMAGAAVLIAVLCAATVVVQLWFWEVAAQVDRARQIENAAAVAGERLRFAAELHDIQGHSLQVIALKSELAARLVGPDPDRAMVEMREVESLARQALRDTREVAHGYRTVTLATEITNATRVLAAAGIRCSTRRDDDLPALAPAAERLLGLVVREATTNVIRHSRAARAEIALTRRDGGVRLFVGNDAPLNGERNGNDGGLAGLAERFTTAGGRLDWRRDAETFSVTASLPERWPTTATAADGTASP